MSLKKDKFIYLIGKEYPAAFFGFLSKKNKKREFVRYQKHYEKYHKKPCDVSYKKFSRMMLIESITIWLSWIFFPITIFLIATFIIRNYPPDRYLPYEEIILINDELQKQWDEEDRLEALQKQTKKH